MSDQRIESEKHFAVQWRYLSNWVTHSKADTAEEALIELALAEKESNSEHGRPHMPHWRAVSIEKIVKRIDEGD